MNVINARLRGRDGLFTIGIDADTITRIDAQHAPLAPGHADDVDAGGRLAIAPLVEPHIHLDAVLTAGEPAWNMSGTLFEGIERWSERKATITHDDTKARAHAAIGMLRDHGIQHVRTHVDVTDPTLAALKAMLEVKEEARGLIDLQIVAFPQEGIESFDGGRALMEQAIDLGADVVGGIPHFENTREQGVSSIRFLMELAERTGCLVDVHCDETDDPQSRFLEVLAEETRVRGMGARVTASHTTAMGSYDNAYCSKLFRLLKRAGLNFVSCPTESIHLQGRFDTFPKRRGVTRVAELDRAGLNVCFGQDSIKDPWYPLGNGNILRVLGRRPAHLPHDGLPGPAALPRLRHRPRRDDDASRRALRDRGRASGQLRRARRRQRLRSGAAAGEGDAVGSPRENHHAAGARAHHVSGVTRSARRTAPRLRFPDIVMKRMT